MDPKSNMRSSVYSQDGHPMQKLFLTDEELKRALLSLIKLCRDFVPVGPDGRLYLPTRRRGNAITELGGPWFVGGAMTPFVDESTSTQKVFKRELGWEVDLNRLVFIKINRYFFNGRAQGGLAHDAFCFTYALPLSQEEIASVHLDPQEYETGGLTPYGLEEISAIKDPFVRKIFQDIWEDPFVKALRSQ